MVWLFGALVLLWIACGPVVLVVVAGALCVPRIRWWAQDRARVSRRSAGWVAGVLASLLLVVVVVPDGWLPIPPAPGVLMGPSYVGRPATPTPAAAAFTQNPFRAVGDSTVRPGPLGLQPEVDTASLGLQRCGRLELASTDLLVALCSERSGRSLRLIDPEKLRPTATQDLPDGPAESVCADDAFYLDAADRAVVATADRRVLAIRTHTDDGGPELEKDVTWDLRPWVPDGDCVVALAPDWSGRIWWASQDGLVGTITPEGGQIGATDLGEPVRHQIATDEAGRTYVVTDEALHQLSAGPDGAPKVLWRTTYDGPSGSAPVLLDGGVVAITDMVAARLGVLFVARDDGGRVCRQSVFEKGDGSTVSDLASLGTGVVVTNNHGYASPRSTILGFTASAGLARVDLVDRGCAVRWTSEVASPSSGARASWPNGLLYVWSKRASLLGVSAWYLTALDAGSGRSMWSVRTGTGLLAGSDHSRIEIGPDGSAWLGTMSGLVRIRDRVMAR